MTHARLRRLFWIGAAAILVAAALIALSAVVRGDLSDTDGRILLTLVGALYTGSAAIAGLTLVDRGPARPLGWVVVALAACCLVVAIAAIWSYGWEGESADPARVAWSAVLWVAAGLIATVSLLLARRPALVKLAVAAGVLAGLGAALSVIGIWREDWNELLVKTLAVAWILSGLSFLLIPVLQRFTAAGALEADSRIVATHGDVVAVAVRGPGESGDVTVEGRLEHDERLVLRRLR